MLALILFSLKNGIPSPAIGTRSIDPSKRVTKTKSAVIQERLERFSATYQALHG
jgi:hypothetical protein